MPELLVGPDGVPRCPWPGSDPLYVAYHDDDWGRPVRDERELAESKQYLIGSMPRTLETNIGIATFLQTAELFGLGLDYDLRLPGLLAAVSRDEVHAAARATLQPSRATIVVAGPYDGSLQ